MRAYLFSLGFLAVLGIFSLPAQAEVPAADYVITIKDHQFSPAKLEIPADKQVTIAVKNLDATPEEFESEELDREKIVPGNGEVRISVGPLKAGTYPYYGEFHQDTAKGTIVVK